MRNSLYTLVLGLALLSCSHGVQQSDTETGREPAARKWILAGYLPEAPETKAYVTFEGNKIFSITDKKPSGSILDTEGWIFPGMIDLHNHIKYNVLPLWSDAKGQFNNRYEWRDNYAPYKTAVNGNMEAYKKGPCEVLEWAELKALMGGTTSVQGIGGKAERICAKAKLARNIEIPGDIDPKVEVMASLDLIYPGTIENAYEPYFKKHLAEIAKKFPEWSEKKEQLFETEYQKLYQNFLEQTGVKSWVSKLITDKRNLKTVAELLFGPGVQGFSGELTAANIKNHIGALDKALDNYFSKNAANTPKARREQLKNFYLSDYTTWLQDYAKLDTSKIKSVDEALENFGVGELLGSKAVLSLKPGVAKFAGQFESLRKRIIQRANPAALKAKKSFGVIVHLVEGRNDDEYNRTEFQMAHELNLIRPGMILIHGTGILKNEFSLLAKNGSSLVWSPFSNLLLYDQTTDVISAEKSNVLVALGSDWSPTGSRNLLGEMKIAKEYLKRLGQFGPGKIYNDRTLVQMVTSRPAKMMNLEGMIGSVEPKALGDVLIVGRKTIKNPWQDLVEANEGDIQLVVLGGFPVIGNADLMQPVESAVAVPMLPDSKCGFAKAFAWNPAIYPPVAGEAAIAPQIPNDLQERLLTMLSAFKKTVQKEARKGISVAELDRLFTCEDPNYSEYVQTFFSHQFDSQLKSRATLRAEGFKQKTFRNPLWKASAAPAFGED